MAWYKFWQRESRAEPQSLEDILLQSGIGVNEITLEQAMTIPAFAASVHLISNTVASLPIRLYKTHDDKISEQFGDSRVDLLNEETGDTLDGFQFKKALVMDYLISGSGYAYIKKRRNDVESLHYVHNQSVAVTSSPDPIFKRNDFNVNGRIYRDYDFVKLLRNTRNGATGTGILQENNKLLSVAYNTLVFEEMLVRTGGNKKGFLKAQGRLSKEAMDELKRAWNNLHTNNTENVIILNNGLEFQESNNSSVEMQVNQNKNTNNNNIYNMFGIPVELMNGKATGGAEPMYESFVKMVILPILDAFEASVNATLLLQAEKGKYRFAFDTSKILMADIEKRYKAYEIAVKNGILQIDEIRRKEKYEPMGLEFTKLGLADVLYFPKTNEIYTPNTNATVKMGETSVEGADKGTHGKQDGLTDTADPEKPATGESPAAETPDEKGVKNNES